MPIPMSRAPCCGSDRMAPAPIRREHFRSCSSRVSQRKLAADDVARELAPQAQPTSPASMSSCINPPSIRIGGRVIALHLSIYAAGPGSERSCRTFPTGWKPQAHRPCRALSASTAISTSPRRRWKSHIDRDRAAALGVTPDQIENCAGLCLWRPAGLADLRRARISMR